MSKWKLPLIICSAIAATSSRSIGVQSSQNKAISLEESVTTAESDINVQEKRRVDLVYNLADCIEQYDSHESETLQNLPITWNGNNVEDVNTAIAAVTYLYPGFEK